MAASEIGSPNMLRLHARLTANARAIAGLRKAGLTDITISRFGLGLKEPYQPRDGGAAVVDALCFPVLAYDGQRSSRYAYAPIADLTVDVSARMSKCSLRLN